MKDLPYITKDSNGKWIKWENEPKIIYPLDRNEKPYWEAKGDFEVIDGDLLEIPASCLIYIEVVEE